MRRNLSNLDAAPGLRHFTYSHPTLLERRAALKSLRLARKIGSDYLTWRMQFFPGRSPLGFPLVALDMSCHCHNARNGIRGFRGPAERPPSTCHLFASLMKWDAVPLDPGSHEYVSWLMGNGRTMSSATNEAQRLRPGELAFATSGNRCPNLWWQS